MDGTYQSVPWGQEAFWHQPTTLRIRRHQYPHISTENAAMIAFTPDEVFGKADRQLSMRPGKYLTRFFPDLSQKAVESAIAAWKGTAQAVLEFAHTPEDIAWVYKQGPRSCMAADGAFEKLPKHPAYAYGAGDLAVAYFKNHPDSKSEQEVAARVLVWPEKNIYAASLYGDYQTLRYLLKQKGYEQASSGNFAGAKILKIPLTHTEGFLMPYMDICCTVTEYEDHFLTGDRSTKNRTYDAGSTAGYACAWVECCNCDYEIRPGEQYTQDGETYCAGCWEDLYSYCGHCGHYVFFEQSTYQAHLSMNVCENCLSQHYTPCVVCGDQTITRYRHYAAHDHGVCSNCPQPSEEEPQQEGVEASV
jgi:hypothetical protein